MSPAPPSHQPSIEPFGDRLLGVVRRLEHPLCVGLDPHLDRLPPLFRTATDPVENVGAFLNAMLDRLGDRVGVVKPQIAFFEQLGWRGVRLLHEIVNRARSAGLLVVLDAKRGDIGSTAAGYARAYLGPDAPLPVDALTVYPYLGADSLAPFIEAARAGGSGLFVLVRTSNPGSSDVQDLCADDEPVYARVARMLAPLGESLRGATGWSSLGVVVGATFPEPAARVRKLLPHAPLLVPGYGAQGGSARDAVRAFVRGEGGRLEGGLVNASRSILFPPDGAAATDAKSWERAVDAALDRAINELRDAIAG